MRALLALFLLALLLYSTSAWQIKRQSGKGQFDPKLAVKSAYLSAAAYAVPHYILEWKFPNHELRGNLTSVHPVQVFVSSWYTTHASGYLALDHREKQVLVAFRGTNDTLDLLLDFVSSLDALYTYADPCSLNGKTSYLVHKGFCWAYQALQSTDLLSAFSKLVTAYPQYEVVVTGHSLGGAIGALFAMDMATRANISMKLYTFGGPRVGDNAFAHAMDQLPIDSWRVVHWNDIVVHLPPCCNGLISYFVNRTCDAHTSGCPYHFGGEVWFPEEMNLTTSPLGVCTDGENMTTCSGSGKIALWQGLMYHVNYYSFRVGKFYEDPNEANVAEAEEIRRFLADPRSRRRVHYR